MKKNKYFILKAFLTGQILLFFGFQFFSKNGYFLLSMYKDDIVQLCKQIDNLKTENNQLSAVLEKQKKHSFFMEKIAREQLQMALADEEIYLNNEENL